MITIDDKSNCCGCSSCFSICPTHAISMQVDYEGFKYPKVDNNKCIGCGLCEKKCPIKRSIYSDDKFVRKGVIARVKNDDILNLCSSGGMFYPIAQSIINRGGYVCGATYNSKLDVIHETTNDLNKLKDYIGSKYVQSDLGNQFKFIKELLDDNKLLVFFGTACQVYGLKIFLGKDYENLFTVDLVCHGTPSPNLWRAYLEYQEKLYKSNIRKVNFRSKKYGYHVASLSIDFENGKQYVASARTDFMLRSFFNEIASRPSCYKCSFKKVERVSDLTVYDAWHADKISGSIVDDDRGYTNLIIQSVKGEKLLEMVKEKIECRKVDLEKAIQLDGIMITQSAKPHYKRDEFYNVLDKEGIEQTIRKFIPISTRDRMIDIFKQIFYRFGILNLIRKRIKK